MQAGLSVAKLNRYNNLPVEGKSRDRNAIQSPARQSAASFVERTRPRALHSFAGEDHRHARRDCSAPDVVAHQPALRGGEPMKIGDYDRATA